MKVGVSPVVLLFALISWGCASAANNSGTLEVRRIDGSFVSTREIEEYVAAVIDSAGVTGLQMAVFDDSTVVYAHEWGLKSWTSGLAPDQETVFPGLSFSKPLFACLVMQLVDEGLLELDRPLVDYLDRPIGDYVEWRDVADDPRVRQITARHVLTHTTGWPNHRALTEEGKLDFIFPPGEWFGYSGEGFRFLQLAVENTVGKPLDALARESLFTPLDMRRTSYVWEPAFEANNADGHTERQQRIKRSRSMERSAAGSLLTTASDFAGFLLALLNGRVLEQDSIDEMFAPQVPVRSGRMFGSLANQATEDNEGIHLAWGLGWGLFDTECGRAFFHTGHDVGWENYTVTYLDRKIGVVLLSNSNNFESIAQRIVERVIGDRSSPFPWLGYQPFNPLAPPPAPESEQETVQINPAIFDEVAGQYEVRAGDYVFLRAEAGRLVGSGDGNDWDDVMAVSETEFFIDGKPYSFAFSRDSDGTVSGLVIFYEGMEIPARRIR